MNQLTQKKSQILNINIDNISVEELLCQIKQGGLLLTPNIDHLVKLQKDYDFLQIYNKAEYVVCDSRIIIYISNFLGNKIKEKISGSDFFPQFYHYYKYDETIKIFLLGGAAGVAEQAKNQINTKVGRQIVVEAYSPSFGFEQNPAECQHIVNLINDSAATVLAIGVGAPKQEKWIAKYRKNLPKIKIFLAIGATINFEAGIMKRAPQWMSYVGLEWFYRLILEPKRLWRRYLFDSLPLFWLILKQKFKLYQYKQPIGLILQQAGLLAQTQVDWVLQYQLHQPQKRFGDIVVSQGWLQEETIDFFVKQLPKLAKKSIKLPIGQYLKAAKLLNEAQIQLILAEQKQTKLRFGEIAVEKGWLEALTVKFLVQTLALPDDNNQKALVMTDSSSFYLYPHPNESTSQNTKSSI